MTSSIVEREHTPLRDDILPSLLVFCGQRRQRLDSIPLTLFPFHWYSFCWQWRDDILRFA